MCYYFGETHGWLMAWFVAEFEVWPGNWFGVLWTWHLACARKVILSEVGTFPSAELLFYDSCAVESDGFQQLTHEKLNECIVESWESNFWSQGHDSSFQTSFEGAPVYQWAIRSHARGSTSEIRENFGNHMQNNFLKNRPWTLERSNCQDRCPAMFHYIADPKSWRMQMANFGDWRQFEF